MDKQNNPAGHEKLLTAVFALLSLIYLVQLARVFSFWSLLWLAASAALLWLHHRGREDKARALAYAAAAVLALIGFFMGFGSGAYELRGFGYHDFWTRESLVCALPALLWLAGFAGMALLAAAQFAGALGERRETVRKLWYLPALLIAVAFLLALALAVLLSLFGGGRWLGAWSIVNLRTLLWFAAALLLGLRVSGHAIPGTRDAQGQPAALHACSVAKLLFLCLITLGIWYLVWIYRTTAALPAPEGRRPRNPLHELLFCLLLPFYGIYWMYKSAQLLEREGETRFELLCLVFAALLTPVSMMLIQDRINELVPAAPAPAESPEGAGTPEPEAAPAEATSEAPEAEESAEAAADEEPAE